MSRAAQQIGCDRRTLARERARCQGEYCPESAERHRGSKRSGRTAYKLRGALKKRLEELIADELSPEQALGRMALEGHPTVSVSTAYRLIYANAADGGTLYAHTRLGRRSPKNGQNSPLFAGYCATGAPLASVPPSSTSSGAPVTLRLTPSSAPRAKGRWSPS